MSKLEGLNSIHDLGALLLTDSPVPSAPWITPWPRLRGWGAKLWHPCVLLLETHRFRQRDTPFVRQIPLSLEKYRSRQREPTALTREDTPKRFIAPAHWRKITNVFRRYTSTGNPERNMAVWWIYRLNKEQLIQELKKYESRNVTILWTKKVMLHGWIIYHFCHVICLVHA